MLASKLKAQRVIPPPLASVLTAMAGGIVVIATLFYLAGQVKPSQEMEKAVAQRDLLQRVAEWNNRIHNESNGDYDKFLSALSEYDIAPTSVQMRVDNYVAEFVFITEAALNMR
jgi:hypothetical protein